MTDQPQTAEGIEEMREQGRLGKREGHINTAEVMRMTLRDKRAGEELHQLAAAWLEGYEGDDC